VQRGSFGTEFQTLRKGNPSHANHWKHDSIPSWTTYNYASVVDFNLLICQENKYTPFSSMGRTILQHYWSCRRTFGYITWEFALCSRNCERNFGYCVLGRPLRMYTCHPCKSARNPFEQEREAPMSADSHCFQALSGYRYRFRLTLVRQGKPHFEKVLYCAVQPRNSACSSPGTLQWFDHGYFPLGLPEIHWTPRAVAYLLDWQRADAPSAEQGAGRVVASLFSHQNPRPHCPARHHLEIKRFQDGLVGRMFGKNNRHHKKIPKESVRAVTGHGRRVANHSSQHRSRHEFKAHNTRRQGRINSCAFPLWCKPEDVTLHNRATKGG